MTSSPIIYAGIGARETPEDILILMEKAGQYLAKIGRVLRSGRARGADQAFERGCDMQSGRKEIFLASDADEKAIKLAAIYHPAWDKCSEFAKRLHGRNMKILFGSDLLTPAKYILCWTKDGLATGGSGQAIRAAEKNNIPVYNLFSDTIVSRLKNLISHEDKDLS